jgi:ATP-dependent RNA helicase RhlE
MNFEDLGLGKALLRACETENYTVATPIQAQAIPIVLSGSDLMGCAQTGTGKTAAFALPVLHQLCGGEEFVRPKKSPNQNRGNRHQRRGNGKDNRKIRCLAIAPTRELADQIRESFVKYGRYTGLRTTVVFGGISQRPQERALTAGVDILVATPGRLLDLKNQGYIDLSHVEVLILDEADQMFDMGFLPDLRRIVSATPSERQTLMFSATMPPEIRRQADQWLTNPQHVAVAPVATPAEAVEQSVFHVEGRRKPGLLAHLLSNGGFGRTLVFARTKHGSDKVVKFLIKEGIDATAIHGNKSQNARRRALDKFKSSRPPVLVATDIAARGLDIDSVSHVVNYDLPEIPETYVHRIGRTGRAGASGAAVTLCAPDERHRLRRIEKLIDRRITVETEAGEIPVQELPNGEDQPLRRSFRKSARRPKNDGSTTKPRGKKKPNKFGEKGASSAKPNTGKKGRKRFGSAKPGNSKTEGGVQANKSDSGGGVATREKPKGGGKPAAVKSRSSKPGQAKFGKSSTARKARRPR